MVLSHLTREWRIIVINPPAKQYIEDWNFENNIRSDDNDQKLPDELNELLQKVIKEEKEVLQELTYKVVIG